MLRLTIFYALILLGTYSCKSQNTSATADSETVIHFGDVIDTLDAISYPSLLEKMGTLDSLQTKVIGTVSGVCQAKGCWMNIVSEADTTGTQMFVQFKDYGFFMPKDLSGKDVVMEGMAYRELTSVDDLRHFAEDEGLSKEEIEKITEPKTELKFMASGVVIK